MTQVLRAKYALCKTHGSTYSIGAWQHLRQDGRTPSNLTLHGTFALPFSAVRLPRWWVRGSIAREQLGQHGYQVLPKSSKSESLLEQRCSGSRGQKFRRGVMLAPRPRCYSARFVFAGTAPSVAVCIDVCLDNLLQLSWFQPRFFRCVWYLIHIICGHVPVDVSAKRAVFHSLLRVTYPCVENAMVCYILVLYMPWTAGENDSGLLGLKQQPSVGRAVGNWHVAHAHSP